MDPQGFSTSYGPQLPPKEGGNPSSAWCGSTGVDARAGRKHRARESVRHTPRAVPCSAVVQGSPLGLESTSRLAGVFQTPWDKLSTE